MASYLNELSAEMTKTVDKLKKTNFKDATPEEIETYAQWSAIMAAPREDLAHRKQVREAESEKLIAMRQEEKESAINALNALVELAQARLKAVENGE